jgi:hypothetical protein
MNDIFEAIISVILNKTYISSRILFSFNTLPQHHWQIAKIMLYKKDNNAEPLYC